MFISQVSVSKSNIPWMPKPDNKYGSVEDLAEKIVLRYGHIPDSDFLEDDGDGTWSVIVQGCLDRV